MENWWKGMGEACEWDVDGVGGASWERNLGREMRREREGCGHDEGDRWTGRAAGRLWMCCRKAERQRARVGAE
eukprot:6179208-Pleurochrysis_carterae.AAC.2